MLLHFTKYNFFSQFSYSDDGSGGDDAHSDHFNVFWHYVFINYYYLKRHGKMNHPVRSSK